jgi:hypothetical protein
MFLELNSQRSLADSFSVLRIPAYAARNDNFRSYAGETLADCVIIDLSFGVILKKIARLQP